MPRINANRDSVDDRFSVLGFTVRTESPLYEVAVATDPTLFRADARTRRVRRNFFSSRAQGALRARRGEAVYLLPQDVLANFVGSSKLYFGLATYREGTTAKPDFVQIPSEGNMYVGLSGLTERGLRRAVSAMTPSSYGTTQGRDPSLEWGGDSLAQAAPASTPVAPTPAASASGARPNGAAPATAASLDYDDGFGAFPAQAPSGDSHAMTPVQAQEVLLRSYDGDLASQLRLFAETVQWVAGVDDTTRFPHSAICKLELWKNGALQGWATAFYVGRRMLLTNAHVVNDADTLVVIPGKNGAGRSHADEPFGRFTCTQMRAHERYTAGSRDFDMAVVHATQDAPNGKWLTPIEELRQSRPEGVGVCGYSARSRRTDLPGTIVNAVLNPDKQHVHRGFVRTLSDENFQYDVQELAGSSGSPVYWIEAGSPPRAHVVGINAGPRDAVVNEGCRFTDAKVAWIRARAAEWHESAAMALDDEPYADTPVQPMELLEQSYDGTLEGQVRLFGQSVQWIAGVPDTRNFPHSAICFVGDIASGAEAEHGTAFFIGRHLLLTAGHVVDGMSRLVFVPGKNGRGIDATHEPFGRFEVALTSSNCFKYPGYAPTTGTDMALVYTGPANAAPGGRWFNIVEELRQSRPEGVGVCGYSQFSSRSGWLPALVNAISDPRKQHLHRGYVRTLPGNDLFTYDVQTLPGASGSPVYWVEASNPPKVHMVGVHIAGDGDTTNRGCRMTDAKVAWLRAKAATFSEAHAFALADSDVGGYFQSGAGNADGGAPDHYVEAAEASADTRPRTPRLAPPPAPVTQQPLGVDEPAAEPTSETVAIASGVTGTTMQRTTVRRQDAELRLDQLRGLKHPGNQPPAQPRQLQDGAPVRLADWPKVNGADGAATAAPVEIRWQFDGISLGNVQIAATAIVAAGVGLRVGARVLDDPVVYPRSAPAFAALRVRLDYAFEAGGQHPIRAFQEVHLFGNGRYNIAGDWVRHGHSDEGAAATALDTRSGSGSGSAAGSGSGAAAGSGAGAGSGSAAAPALPTFPLPWEAGNAGRAAWTRELIAAVVAHKADLDRGSPDTFIPGYANLSADLQVRFWCEFLVAISHWESGWNPRDTFTEANGVASIGLFALSYPDAQVYPLVGLDQARDTLKDPLINLRAAVVILSTLVARHGMVVGSATTGRSVEFKGGAAYWSVLRTERKHLADIRQRVKDGVGIH